MSYVHQRTLFRYSLAGSLLLLGACCRKPENLSSARDKVMHYYEVGCFENELCRVIKKAKKRFSAPATSPRQVVIFDVDETALSEYRNLKSIAFGYVPKLSHEWVMCACAPAMPEVRDLYHYVLERGYHVIFVSGRRHNEAEATKRNLLEQGFTGFDRLIVRSQDEETLTAFKYKSEVRTRLTQEGYEIVGCVADQWSDLEGPYTGRAVKIPNYIYVIE